MQTIALQEVIQKKNVVFIDTRTPGEFEEDHIPGAVNIPIFSNEERAVVGTMYTQESKEKAIEKGIEFFSRKMPEFMREINKYKEKELIIYCWRGGMRSKTVTSLLDSLGYKVRQLAGGHKAYRAYVREALKDYTLNPKLIVLWGLTCTGKTELLHPFPNSVDLEGLAQHRGSLYGAIGLKPSSQKWFDSQLLKRLHELQDEKWIVVEGESKKIGEVQIPAFFYQAMMCGEKILITRSLQQRAEHAVKTYFSENTIGSLKTVTQSLFKVISAENKRNVIASLEAKEYVAAAKILLEFYYDPLYDHTLKKITFSGEIDNEDGKSGIQQLKEKLKII